MPVCDDAPVCTAVNCIWPVLMAGLGRLPVSAIIEKSSMPALAALCSCWMIVTRGSLHLLSCRAKILYV